MTGPAKIPTAVADYMRAVGVPVSLSARDHPVITQVFLPERGWRRYSIRKRISASWARKMRAEGITNVAINLTPAAGRRRIADFTIKELCR